MECYTRILDQFGTKMALVDIFWSRPIFKCSNDIIYQFAFHLGFHCLPKNLFTIGFQYKNFKGSAVYK